MSDVERYVPQGELSTRSEQDLALVGFSPNFPTRVRELFDGLATSSYQAFQGYRFNLSPDYEHPRVDVAARNTSPYAVTIDAGIDQRAVLDIRPKAEDKEWRESLCTVRLSQLREFTDTYPTEETIALHAVKSWRPFPSSEPIPFNSINSAADLRAHGITPARFRFWLGFEQSDSTLSLACTHPPEARTPEPVLTVHSVYAKDRADVVESVVGSVGRLLGKNWSWNARPQEDM